MPVAHSLDRPSRQPLSSTPAEPSGVAGPFVLIAAIAALALALLGCAYFETSAGDGYPDSTQQWTD